MVINTICVDNELDWNLVLNNVDCDPQHDVYLDTGVYTVALVNGLSISILSISVNDINSMLRPSRIFYVLLLLVKCIFLISRIARA